MGTFPPDEGERCCTRCGNCYPLNELNWYPARPRSGRQKAGWQSYCKSCWKDINRSNREKRKSSKTECRIYDEELIAGLIEAVDDFLKARTDDQEEEAYINLKEMRRKLGKVDIASQ